MSAPAEKPNTAPGLPRWAPWLLFALLLAGMAAVQGFAYGYDVSYEITNGDFQNYDPVRHLLAGQAPYADFTVYLGAGELYGVGAVLLVIGNTFANSVFAANFLTWLSFELLVLAVCLAVLGEARPARSLTLALSGYFLLAVRGVPLPLAGTVRELLFQAGDVGNSARMLRTAVLPLAVLAVAAVLAGQRRGGRPAWLPKVLIPLLAGALVPWSNDMGAAMYIAVALAYGLLLLRHCWPHPGPILRGTLAYIGFSTAGLGACVTLVSQGHPLAWLRQTRGAGAYQSWYYGSDPAQRLCYLTDLRLSAPFWVLLVLAAAAALLVLRAGNGQRALRAAGVFALCLGMALWEPLYAVGSGVKTGPAQGAAMLLAVLAPALTVCLLRQRLPHWPERPLAAGCAALAAVCLAVGAWGQWQRYRAGHEGLFYSAGLGGWLDDKAERLETERQLTAGEPVFSTYASGLEAITGQLQPTGTDYIIHVLGDAQRVRYLQMFQTGYESGLFAFACTPSPKVVAYERWARNANWWFYRELYRYWQPVANTYNSGGLHLFWKKGGGFDLGVPITLTVEQTAPGAFTLTATAAESDFNGVADVRLDYALTAPVLALHSYLFVDCTTENDLWSAAGREGSASFFLPGQGSAANIPITIANGTGAVTVSALPAGAPLTVQGTVEGVYPDWTYFFE